MSMKIVEDRFGKELSLEATGSHDWRRLVGLYLLGTILFLWSVGVFILIKDPVSGWITKIILLSFATIVAGLLAIFVQH